MFKRPKAQEKKGSEKREVLLVSFWKVARFVFAIIYYLKINPDNVKILETANHTDAYPLTDWIKEKGLQEILNQIKV